MRQKFTGLLLPTLTAMLLAGCTVGPDYVRPAVEVPAAFKQDWKPARPADELPRGAWWEVFGDAPLNELASQVEIGNHNLAAAEARYRQARALAQQARTGFYPTVSGEVSVTRSRAATSAGNNAGGVYATQHRLGLDASWEPDIWGRVQRTVEAGEAGIQASAAELQAARLSAQADLAQNYFLLRIADARRRLLDETVAAYERSLKLTQNQYAVGVAARGDVVVAETQLRSAQAQAIDTGVQRAQLEHAIAVLVGKAPAELSIAPLADTPLLPAIPAGIPSELLERRPDIAAAERRAAEANARIGVEQAAFYPSFTLSATAGLQSGSFARWLSAPSRFWTLGPALAQVIFDAGLRRARTEQAVAVFDENAANYRQTVLTAFQEVENNLATLRILEQEAALQEEAVQAARESVAITTNQYRAGTVSYLDVVNVQTIALSNERAALDVLGGRLTAAVQLIKALGGGWNPAEMNIEPNAKALSN